MAQYWVLTRYSRSVSPIFRAPAVLIRQLSLGGWPYIYRAVAWAQWKGPDRCEHWTSCGLYCSNGDFYNNLKMPALEMTIEQAQIYYEHYSHLARIGNWAPLKDNKWRSFDKWTITPTQLRYDGKIIKALMRDTRYLYNIMVDPHHDYIVFMVLSTSLAMSELW